MKLSELRGILPGEGHPDTRKKQEDIFAGLLSAGIIPGEVYQELEMESKYVDTHRDTSFTNTAISLHSHDFFEILCCRNTCGAEYLVGAKRYKLQKGDILFVAPGVSHRPILPEHMPEPYERDVLWISKEFAQDMVGKLPELEKWELPTTNLIRTAGTKWEFLEEKFHNGVREAEGKQFGWEMAVIGNTLQLVTNIWRALRYQTAREMKAEVPELLDQVMAYIETNLEKRITLKDTAKQFYVSESTISHLFQQKMGVSFYRCVTQRRLIAAKELIWQGIGLEEISRQVGFQDYSSFYRAFRQEYGISPKQYRKLQSGK